MTQDAQRQLADTVAPRHRLATRVSDRACGKLLAPFLPLLLAALERHGALDCVFR